MTGSRPLDERLYDLWLVHIMGLKEDEIPPSVMDKHRAIYSALEKSAKPMHVDMRGTCTLGELEEHKVAEDILSVFMEIVRIRSKEGYEDEILRHMEAGLKIL